MNNPFFQTVFILIFQLAGGIAIGAAVRALLRRQFGCGTLFFVFWGLGFGGLPLAFGVQAFTEMPWLLALQLFVFLGAIIVTAFLPDILLESLKSDAISKMLMGAIFGGIGLIFIASILFDQTEWSGKLFAGLMFAPVGIGLFWSGVRSLAQS